MAYSAQVVQDQILDDLRTALPGFDIVEQSIPDIQTVPRRNGQIVPVYTVQIGMPIPQGATSMVGPWGDDHSLSVYVQAIAPSAKIARQMANRMDELFLGSLFEWSGNVRKYAEGYPFPITTSTGSTEAYQTPTAYRVPVQLSMDA